MSEKSLQQCNPTLDKMSTRLNLAGAGALGPILKGLAGTVQITVGADEDLVSVRIYSDTGDFNNVLSGTFASLGDGRRLWTCDIVYGTDTAFGLTGGVAVRNYLEWVIRKVQAENIVLEPIDFDNPYDRSFFSLDRDYTLDVMTSLNDGELDGVVGMAWRDETKEIYLLSDTNYIKIVNRAGVATRSSNISLPSNPFTAPQDILYLGSDRFAILNEGGSFPTIVLFHIRADEEELLSDFIVYELPDVAETGGGARGFAYDSWRDKWYVGTQSIAAGEGGLYEVDLHADDTNGNPTTTLLYEWNDVVTATDGLDAGALLGSLFYSPSLGAGSANDSLFCLFRDPGGGSAAQRQILQLDIQSGELISTFSHGLTGGIEALLFSEYNEEMFFGKNDSGINFWRYSHTAFADTRTFLRQFWVKDIPFKGGLYLHNQEAQLGEAVVFINQADSDPYAHDATFGINVLPVFSDEFFTQHEYIGNRYAQTIRNWGGATTVEFWVDGGKVIDEIDIGDLAGYFWDDPDYGLHEVFVRLRADWSSAYYVDIPGYIRFRQFPCS